MKNNILKLYIVAFYFCATFVTFAQPGTDDNGGGLEGSDPAAPIDDYVWVLALIGMAFVLLKCKSIYKQGIKS